MGSQSQAIQFLSQFPLPISHNYYLYNKIKTCRRRCFSGGGGSRWDWEKNVNPNRRSRFSDSYMTDDDDEIDEFGFRYAAKQRIWWSDDYDDDEGEDEGFGVLEASIDFNWVLKVFQAFGWMIPAVIISLLLGTGPNAIVMALALPLAQSAFSLLADMVWGRSDDTPRPKSKNKRRPFAGARSRTRARKEMEKRTQKEGGNYKSWVDANNVSGKNERRNPRDFGGWDELDNQVGVDNSPRVMPVEKANEPRAQGRAKISRRIKSDTPLVSRLLIAMFPFLRFWTKLL